VNDIDNTAPTGQRILAIPGSLRRNSTNLRLLEAAAACAPHGMRIHVYRDLASIPMFNEDDEHADTEGTRAVQQLRRRIAASDGLLVATPEYNHSIPGVLKNAIDWSSRAAPGQVLKDKPIAIVGATSGRWGTRLAQSALRQVFYATESLVMPAPALFIREANSLFDSAGDLTDEPTRASLREVLDSLSSWINLTRPAEAPRCAPRSAPPVFDDCRI
jgi:chromate reductase